MVESDDHDIFGVTSDSKMTFEKHLQRLLKDLVSSGPEEYSMIDRFLVVTFGVLSCPFWSIPQCGAQLLIHTVNYGIVLSVVPVF